MSEEKVKVTDKRHWAKAQEEGEPSGEETAGERLPTYVENLKKQVEAGEAKLQEYISAYREKMAENDRFRERLQKDVERRVEGGMAEIFRNLLPMLDNFELAMTHARETHDIEKLMEGVSMIKFGLLNQLLAAGMKEVDCLGKEFDPAMAEAVSVEDVTDESSEHKVLEIIQPGYMLNGLLLRPARVKVGRHRKQ